MMWLGIAELLPGTLAASLGPGPSPGVALAQVSWVPRLVAPSPKLPLVKIGSAAAGGPDFQRSQLRAMEPLTIN